MSIRKRTPWLIVFGMVALCIAFVGLGIWQLQRLQWKLALIERVNSRMHAAPVAAPAPTSWPQLTAANAEYRHVTITGRFDSQRSSLVRATTALGMGYWVMTPLQTADGSWVWINRGYVPMHRNARQADAAAPIVTLTGLLRMTEPKGSLLQQNDPGKDRWYSRDMAALTIRHHLDSAHTAPYFIDTDATQASQTEAPVPGLTVVSFRNPHLGYALTWFSLSLLPALFILFTIRPQRRSNPDAEIPKTNLKN